MEERGTKPGQFQDRIIATFRVARLTLQTRKDVATVFRATFDLPECEENLKRQQNEKKRKQKKT